MYKSELKKIRKQIEYMDEIDNVLLDTDDGGLYRDFTEEENNIFDNFLDFMSDLRIAKEKQLKAIEKNIVMNNKNYNNII